ncbi:hypothetical protein Ahy_A01g003619 [Arachis hypogaea]|uniref:PB1-like domain-containing protein n=1 Tax=Arachis hypogaea TaxID=3818 RepID=A0A445ETM7_ARAHY|nr:hypothetical protein Ahy_A01g003619 [Arachis hypogaea]
MALFNTQVHHGGAFGYENSVLKYLKGQATVVEDIDDDKWSVFEAYEELRQLGYLKSTITALWYKDPTADDYESQLKLLKGDTEAIEMCTIVGKKGFVDLFVVHEVGDADGFPKVGYLDANILAKGDSNHDSSCEDSDDPTYLPSNEEENSVKDIHFTDSEEVYDYEMDSVKIMLCRRTLMRRKPKREEAAEGEGQRFPVHKSQKDMGKYQWKVDTLYESWQEFKDTVAGYAVHIARNIKFKKCDLVRVRAVCQKGCPFWLYAHRVGEESTWQLRSMNLQHTCIQTHWVEIMHSKWLGSQFKKKVESNPRIKVKELVARAHKKWNLTVTKAMAAKTKRRL